MKKLIRMLKDRFVSLNNFIHGGWTENPEYHREKWERERVQYAKDNAWVLHYGFGHHELIRKYSERPSI